MTSGLNCLLKSRVPPPSFPPYHTSQVKSAPTPVGEPNVRAEAEKSQVSPNARRRAQCKGGGGKEKSIYVHTNDCTIFFLFFLFSAPFSRKRSLVDDCFTGQSPGSAISIPAAPDVHEGLGQIQASAP